METLFKNYAYPLNNYQWNYKGYVDKHYKPELLGVNNRLSIGQFKHNVRQGVKYFDGLMYDGNPGNDAVAGVTDIHPNDTAEVSKRIQNNKAGLPYRRFRVDYPESEYPTNGKFSSSYFVQSGFCPVASATSKQECSAQDSNYTWIPNPVAIPDIAKKLFSDGKDKIANVPGDGTCFKPRYSYVNNAPESDISTGMIPSLVNDIDDMNPAYLLGVSMGKPVMGSRDSQPPRFQLLPCVEGFENSKQTNLKDFSAQQKMLNQNISDKMEEFQSSMAGSLMIDRPNIESNRQYILPPQVNNEHFQNPLVSQEVSHPEDFLDYREDTKVNEHFSPSGYDTAPAFKEVAYPTDNQEKLAWMPTKLLHKTPTNAALSNPLNDLLGCNPIVILLIVLFLISLIYIGSQ